MLECSLTCFIRMLQNTEITNVKSELNYICLPKGNI